MSEYDQSTLDQTGIAGDDGTEWELSQQEADWLLGIPKWCVGDGVVDFPPPAGEKVIVPVESPDHSVQFSLDILRSGRIISIARKGKYQTRARGCQVLARVEFNGPVHCNPDGTKVPCPHLHRYRAGYGLKWASPLPLGGVLPSHSPFDMLLAFMHYCNIGRVPSFELGIMPW